MYLSTSPYLSFAGAHLPRLKVPVPLHLIFGRRVAFATFRLLARHAAWTLREPANENSFIKAARRGEVKEDDLLEKVRVAGFAIRLRSRPPHRSRRAARHRNGAEASGADRSMGPRQRADQDALISNMEYVLAGR